REHSGVRLAAVPQRHFVARGDGRGHDRGAKERGAAEHQDALLRRRVPRAQPFGAVGESGSRRGGTGEERTTREVAWHVTLLRGGSGGREYGGFFPAQRHAASDGLSARRLPLPAGPL